MSPYVNIYTTILDSLAVEYDIISWNREGLDRKIEYQYSECINSHDSRLKKMLSYYRYTRFIKKILNKGEYDKLIVFGSQLVILLGVFLIRNCHKRFMVDFRDLSIEQHFILKKWYGIVLKHSCLNVISSPGFERYLPSKINYVLSHNFVVKNIDSNATNVNTCENHIDQIKILTIGGIRDFESNKEVLSSLGNNPKYLLNFVGKGYATPLLAEYASIHSINNVAFEGYYPKEREDDYIKGCTMLNIYYPKKKSHLSALSNRFYHALIHKKGMIVTSNSVQGDYVSKYGLGIVVDNCNDLDCQIQQWLQCCDPKKFADNCNMLLHRFKSDYEYFCKSVYVFLGKK